MIDQKLFLNKLEFFLVELVLKI